MTVKIILFVLFLGVADAGFVDEAVKHIGHDAKKLDRENDVLQFFQDRVNFTVSYSYYRYKMYIYRIYV